jgi:hypothetical protein
MARLHMALAEQGTLPIPAGAAAVIGLPLSRGGSRPEHPLVHIVGDQVCLVGLRCSSPSRHHPPARDEG